MKDKTKAPYENNPFFIGFNGLQLLFKNATQVAIYAAVLVGFWFIVGTAISIVLEFTSAPETSQGTSSDEYVMPTFIEDMISSPQALAASLAQILPVTAIVFLISTFFYGILEYTAARLTLGESVTFKQALSGVWKKYPGYLWVKIITFVKLVLWSLLFIIPGFIMSIRYSLAGIVYFAEDKKGNMAVRRSSAITKHAWFTTFAGTGLWNLITGNQAGLLINPAANVVLYRQLALLTDENKQKPNAHWLSWLTFFGPLILLIILLALFFIVFIAILLPILLA